MNDARRFLLHEFASASPGLERSGLEILNDDIGFPDQLPQNLLPARLFKIQSDAALVAVYREKICGFRALEGRTPTPRVIAADGLLDLHYVGSHIAEDHGAERSGENAG
jgi:hypothetical protein